VNTTDMIQRPGDGVDELMVPARYRSSVARRTSSWWVWVETR